MTTLNLLLSQVATVALLIGAVARVTRTSRPLQKLWSPPHVLDLSYSYNESTIYWDESIALKINRTILNDTVDFWCVGFALPLLDSLDSVKL